MLLLMVQFKISYISSLEILFHISMKIHTHITSNSSLDLILSSNIIATHHHFCFKISSLSEECLSTVK